MDPSIISDLDPDGGTAEGQRPLEHLVGWAHGCPGPAVREDKLPPSLPTVVADARAERRGRSLTCLASRTPIDGTETTRLGATRADIPASELALAVVPSSVTIDAVAVVAHMLVTQIKAA